MEKDIWISKEKIPELIILVEREMNEIIRKIESDPDYDFGDGFDGNDCIIFQMDTLPFLKDKKNTGFHSSEMFYKSWRFLQILSPDIAS